MKCETFSVGTKDWLAVSKDFKLTAFVGDVKSYNDAEIRQDIEDVFTRDDFFKALEASAVELGADLKELEKDVPERELKEWLSAFEKAE